MISDQFRECCGICEIGPFPGDRDLDDGLSLRKQTEKELREALEECSPLAVIATTVSWEREAVRALKARRFRKVARFSNPNSGNMVTLWYRGPSRQPKD